MSEKHVAFVLRVATTQMTKKDDNLMTRRTTMGILKARKFGYLNSMPRYLSTRWKFETFHGI
ncbi:predicted protein [Sclerotinia sclerotiorum 1980 UF-70]|uniref:Uncharacterized protein n=1 Tax=Sclerotinia sclerotiorum (strain ATCC 18683 / 1980 / Ss-1) TaxID=665079 RepID=A7E840_SCLS1|nr:predicted protein [Sclerotinia sclerotiorum 1980 UF-70]EDN96542.1 predicted protein [Sclerotinia sclerotiorum 1980 UF-70]